jgi:hypothetical protein
MILTLLLPRGPSQSSTAQQTIRCFENISKKQPPGSIPCVSLVCFPVVISYQGQRETCQAVFEVGSLLEKLCVIQLAVALLWRHKMSSLLLAVLETRRQLEESWMPTHERFCLGQRHTDMCHLRFRRCKARRPVLLRLRKRACLCVGCRGGQLRPLQHRTSSNCRTKWQ